MIIAKKKQSRKLAILGFWVFSIIILFLIFIKWTSTPTKGTINLIDKMTTKSVIGNNQLEKLDGKFFTTKYPSNYKVSQKESSSSGTLEKIILLGTDMNSQQIVSNSIKTNETDLSDISGVQYRELKKDLYVSEPIIISGRDGLLYKKTDGSFERTFFFLKDGILTTISMTAPSINKDLDKDFQTIRQSLSWR